MELQDQFNKLLGINYMINKNKRLKQLHNKHLTFLLDGITSKTKTTDTYYSLLTLYFDNLYKCQTATDIFKMLDNFSSVDKVSSHLDAEHLNSEQINRVLSRLKPLLYHDEHKIFIGWIYYINPRSRNNVDVMVKLLLTNLDMYNTRFHKLCCLEKKTRKSRQGSTSCISLGFNKLNIARDFNNKRIGIFTLLIRGDGYLSGVMTLGQSIRQYIPYDHPNIFTCVMVDETLLDNTNALDAMKSVYNEIFLVKKELFHTDFNIIKHRDMATKKVYNELYIKLRVYEFYKGNKQLKYDTRTKSFIECLDCWYDRVLFIDADALVMNAEFFQILKAPIPAILYLGRITTEPYKTESSLKEYYRKSCSNHAFNKIKTLSFKPKFSIPIESSLFLIKPDRSLVIRRDKLIDNVRRNYETRGITIASDTEFLSLLEKQYYAIDIRFNGRWVDYQDHPEILILDLYGWSGKPWQIEKFDKLYLYPDINNWWSIYSKFYENVFIKLGHPALDKLYKEIEKYTKKTSIN